MMHSVVRPVLALLAALLVGSALAAQDYFVQSDTVRGAVGAQGAVCVANTVFHPGEHVVWRAYVYDAETGERLDQETIEERGVSVTAKLASGEEAPLHYVPHPSADAPNADWFWAGGFVVPEDFPTGTVEFTIEVADEQGGTGTFTPIGQGAGLNLLTIVPAEAE